VNCWLDTDDGFVVREIARAVREIDGGLPGVRALGIVLESLGVAQVSMNLVDLPVTSLEDACGAVRRMAEHEGFEVTKVEIVGLIPATELGRASAEFREWAGLTPELTVEGRLASAASGPDGGN
jgi:glutamate formiminotransferase